ncbi:site-specific integrase [Weissella tructae]
MASFEKRGNKFRAVVSYTNAQGIRKKESKTFDLKKEAVKWASDLETKINNGYDASASKQSFPDYFDEWIATYKLKSVRETTQLNYLRWAKIIRSLFADVPMNKLSTPLLQKELDKFGETHSPGYMLNITTALKSSLKDAHIDGVISKDIYTRLTHRGNNDNKRNNKNYLDAREFETLQNYLYEHSSEFVTDPFRLMVLISLETGARLGEVLALTSLDVDLTHSKISIDKSYSTQTKVVTEPKNKFSIRTVSVSSGLTDILANYMSSIETDDLFTKRNYVRMAEYMNTLTEPLKLTNITFHGLRHSHVSYLLHNDIDVNYISKRVGHKDTSVTLSTYAHMLKEKEDAQDNLTLNVLNLDNKKRTEN